MPFETSISPSGSHAASLPLPVISSSLLADAAAPSPPPPPVPALVTAEDDDDATTGKRTQKKQGKRSFRPHHHADQDERRLCGACSRTSDNRYFDCPARMADGRLFTDYRPRCAFVATQARGMAPVSNHTARQLMTKGADALIARDRREAKARAACGPCTRPPPDTMLPPAMLQKCDARACAFLPARNPPPPRGHGPVYQNGIERDYGDSGGVFSAADEEQRRMWGGEDDGDDKHRTKDGISNCCIPPQEDPDFLPNSTYSSLGQGSDLGRLTAPFGGETTRSVGGDPTVARYAMGKAVDVSPSP